MKVAAFVVVVVISFISGGFAIPTGYALGLEPIEVYVASVVGSMVGMVVFLYAGDALRSKLMKGRDPSPPAEGSRIRELTDRYGAKGLGLVGPLFPGVTASVVLGLALGLPRPALARWTTIGIAALFAVYTFGLWALVEIFGLD